MCVPACLPVCLSVSANLSVCEQTENRAHHRATAPLRHRRAGRRRARAPVMARARLIFAALAALLAARGGAQPYNVTTFVGGGTAGFADGTGTSATFKNLQGIVIHNGILYVADTDNHRVRMITLAGVVTPPAGGAMGFLNAVGTNAKFKNPAGVAITHDGTVLITDSSNHCVRSISPSGATTTLAGSCLSSGFADSVGTNAKFSTPFGITIALSGIAYVTDFNNHRIRSISPAGNVTTLAGQAASGGADGVGTNAFFDFPYFISTTNGTLFITELNAKRIRSITLEGTAVRTLAVFDDDTGVTPYAAVRDSSGYLLYSSNARTIRGIDLRTTISYGFELVEYDETGITLSGGARGIAIDEVSKVYYVNDNYRIVAITPLPCLQSFYCPGPPGSMFACPVRSSRAQRAQPI